MSKYREPRRMTVHSDGSFSVTARAAELSVCQYCSQPVEWAKPRGFGEFVHTASGSHECAVSA